ncbi:lipocalin family protein [Flavobacterium muglaense]|uniref:Lipocalin family protein n=1 Tax=Flavobacterium muglaense TaxID=2764716 RepID=A0A923N3S8_9FLAO|nr:lipocalin family protein [Flavobacterium muglaense]MBC5839743.1 lipocalin family protein [Flavobacterium muglaense]MBC5846270.1 lipocalin family protein [Flavobacterium muglaense]
MKKLLFLFASITLLSCSKNDDDNSTSTTGNIVAKWHLTSILENGKPITGYTCNTNFDITEFTSSGQSITKYSDKNSSNVCTQYTDNGTYTLSDNILTDVQKNGTIKIYEAKYKIKELTATSLKLETISVFEANSNGSNPYTSNYTDGEEVKVYTKTN